MIYRSKYLSPNGTTIDATVANDITATVQGTKCTKYVINITDMNGTSVFSSGDITPTTPIYNDETITYSLAANTLTNGNQYKLTIITYEDSIYATSKEVTFYAYALPVVSMTVPATITSKKYAFIFTYTQAQSIGVKEWYMIFYDSDDVIILTTDYSTSGNYTYTYDGFVNGESYKVKVVTESEKGVIVESSVYSFTVSYSKPSLNIVPTVTLLPELSAIQVDYSPPIQNTGVVTGTSSYITDLFVSDNTGLNLATNSDYIEYTADVPEEFTWTIDVVPAGFTTGKLVEFEDADGILYTIGYEDGRFYFNNNGVYKAGLPMDFPTSVFRIGIRGTEVVIIWNSAIYDYIYV